MARRKGRARRAGASKSGTVRKMKMYREQVSCVVARGDIAVAVVMKDSPVWSCHGDGTQGAESQQEAAGETGHSRDRKSTSALMGTYRSLRRRAVQERYTITTHNTTLQAYADLKKGWNLTNYFFYVPKTGLLYFHSGSKIHFAPHSPMGGELRKLSRFLFPFAAYITGRGVNSNTIYYTGYMY